MKLSNFIGVNTSFALGLLAWSSDASISSNSSMSATILSPFQSHPTWQDFWTNLMYSRCVLRRDTAIFDHCSKRYHWSVKEHSAFHMVSSLRLEILNVSEIAVTFHRIHSTADVPSLMLRTALSTIPFVSDLCGVDVEGFQDNSSLDLPNSKELSEKKTFGFLVRFRNFIRFFWVSWEVFVLHE